MQNNNNEIIIALDGFAGCGKSSTAKAVARELGYRYLDTGAMYRAVTHYFLEHLVPLNDTEEIKNALCAIHLNFAPHEQHGPNAIFLNDECIEAQIRTMRVSDYVSEVSAISVVRAFLVKQQQAIGQEKGLVADGRDVGTVIFPNAELKIFMSASMKARAQRRRAELLLKGESVAIEEIIKNLEKRDKIDTQRADSPLTKAPDAMTLDTSELTFEQQVADIVLLAQNKIRAIGNNAIKTEAY